MKTKKPEIFISYSWQTKDFADKITNDLRVIGISLIKDNQELEYTNDIPSFMKRIRTSDYALLLISEQYLKSKNCLFEIVELQKDENHWNKVLPIVFKGTKIYSAIERLTYIKYWENQAKELEEALKTSNPINLSESYKELKLYTDIANSIGEFLKKISDSLHFSPEEIVEKNYEPIINRLDFDYEPQALVELLRIVLIQNLEIRELQLENYIVKFPESSQYYSIKAGTARDMGKFDQSIHYYNKGLKFDSMSYELLNNLGQVLEKQKGDFLNARFCYERAIKSDPKSDIPRLNLGVLLKNQFGDLDGAKKQYESILEFDPNNVKAHNNLSGIYKKVNATKEELDKAEFHLKKALEIDPEFIDALLNYGNFLKAFKKDIEGGNSYYRKVKELDKNGVMTKMINTLLASNKG